jgi:broad specificity phosphatase PhoE
VSFVYFFRHGQAGTRDNYDALSAVGERQAAELGRYLASERIEFGAVYSGAMQRQRGTAARVADAYRTASVPFPEIEILPALNEFDLDHVYSELAPLIAREDESFRREYETMLEQVRLSEGSPEAEVHRLWSPCDIQVVDSWIRSRYPYSGESWDAFRARVGSCRPVLNGGGEGNIAIFTSATPTAIWTGLALEIGDFRILPLAGALYNTSITALRLRGQQLRLFSFNGVPHLKDAGLRTFR